MSNVIVTQFLQPLFSNLIKDEAGILQPLADNYLTAVLANPTPETVVAQSLAYASQAAALEPQAANTGIKDTATQLKAFLDAQIPSLVVKAQAAVTA